MGAALGSAGKLRLVCQKVALDTVVPVVQDIVDDACLTAYLKDIAPGYLAKARKHLTCESLTGSDRDDVALGSYGDAAVAAG